MFGAVSLQNGRQMLLDRIVSRYVRGTTDKEKTWKNSMRLGTNRSGNDEGEKRLRWAVSTRWVGDKKLVGPCLLNGFLI